MKLTMKQYKRYSILILVAVVSLVAIAFFASGGVLAKQAATKTVRNFGAEMKNISLLAPKDTLKSDIQTHYDRFATDALMEQWLEDPTNAPGRETSSPWPEKIEIRSVQKQGQSYIVSGEIVMMTSNEVEKGGNAGTIPVILQLIEEDGEWQIAAYQEQNQPSER